MPKSANAPHSAPSNTSTCCCISGLRITEPTRCRASVPSACTCPTRSCVSVCVLCKRSLPTHPLVCVGENLHEARYDGRQALRELLRCAVGHVAEHMHRALLTPTADEDAHQKACAKKAHTVLVRHWRSVSLSMRTGRTRFTPCTLSCPIMIRDASYSAVGE